jgi:hypothetical protein
MILKLKEVSGELFFLFGHGEIDFARLPGLHTYFFGPGGRSAVHRPFDFGLRRDIENFSLGENLPALVPGHNFIIAGRHLGELEKSVLVGDSIVGCLTTMTFAFIHTWPALHFSSTTPFLGSETGMNWFWKGNGILLEAAPVICTV